MIICCMLDRKAGFDSDSIKAFINEDTSKRAFKYAVNQAGIMNYAPSDFEFYKIGEFDTKTAQIKSCLPELLLSGIDCVGE